MTAAPLVAMRGITRSFGAVQALRGAGLVCERGEVHALLGENGAGKTTLMHILFGMLQPDAGTVELNGAPVRFRTAADALAAGLGMVHQHFTQVDTLTVAENAWLGRRGWRYDAGAAAAAVARVGRDTGLVLDPAALAGDLAVGLKQRLEIVKALVRDVAVLILDEPSAALTPAEAAELFAALRRLRDSGVGIVLITHKLREVAAIADRVTVLRRGEVVLTGRARDFTSEALARAMVGADAAAAAVATVTDVPAFAPGATADAPCALEAAAVSIELHGRIRVRDASLEVRAGEIVGIAAVEGNGQRELLRGLAGLLPVKGSVRIAGALGFVPEDRQREGLILDFTVAENFALGAWIAPRLLAAEAARQIAAFDIRPTDPAAPARALSGGNQQKVVVARALAGRPSLLIAENPTCGLDVHATAEIHQRLRRAAVDDGLGVLFYSTDLDEVLALAGRIAVMREGRLSWVPDGRRTRDDIGAMMLARDAA